MASQNAEILHILALQKSLLLHKHCNLRVCRFLEAPSLLSVHPVSFRPKPLFSVEISVI